MNFRRHFGEGSIIAASGVIHLGISDHSLIYTVWKFAVPKTTPTIKEVQNFKQFVEWDFINDLSRVSSQNVECFGNPNLAWQAWKSDFNVTLDHHAPIRHMRARQSSVPWLTFDIKKTIKVHLTPKFLFGRDETVQLSHKEFANFISMWYF